MKRVSALTILLSGILVLALTVPFMSTAAAQTAQTVKNYFSKCNGYNCDNVLNVTGTWKIGTTAVTGTAAEMNVLHGVTAGTVAASKAVVVNSSRQVDYWDILTTFKIGGAAVTASAANLNAIPTATGTGAVIDAMTKGYCTSPTVALSASAAVQTATITCKDADGTQMAVPVALTVYVADDSAGATVSSAAVNGAVSFTTGSTLKADTAKLVYRVITDATGVAVLSLDNTGGTDHYAHYVAVVLPGGKLKVSLVTDVRSS